MPSHRSKELAKIKVHPTLLGRYKYLEEGFGMPARMIPDPSVNIVRSRDGRVYKKGPEGKRGGRSLVRIA